MQGTLDGRPFLVTCPIDRYAYAVAEPVPGRAEWSLPDGYAKVAQGFAHAAALGWFGKPALGGRISFRTELARGKGMASSSADIAAALAAAAWAVNRDVTPESLGKIAAAVEPTDGVMFPGVVLMDHVRGEVMQELGEAPPLSLVLFDVGGFVDTLAFHQTAGVAHRAHEQELRACLDVLIEGFAQGDASLIGHAATTSALLHQALLPKPGLERLVGALADLGAVGVCVAHSGTLVGVVIPGDDVSRELEREAARVASRTMPGAAPMGVVRLISGGLRRDVGVRT